jgi:hypothetical protein
MLKAACRMMARLSGEWSFLVWQFVFIEKLFSMPQWGALGREDGFGVGGERGDIESRLHAFGLCLLVGARCGDGREGAPVAPFGMTLGKPSGVGDTAQALFDAAVTGVGFARLGASFTAGGVGEEQLGVFMQAGLIALCQEPSWFENIECQTPLNRDPSFSSKRDPFSGARFLPVVA